MEKFYCPKCNEEFDEEEMSHSAGSMPVIGDGKLTFEFSVAWHCPKCDLILRYEND